jgi:hypothetical protein
MDSRFRFCQRKRLSHADYSREKFFFFCQVFFLLSLHILHRKQKTAIFAKFIIVLFFTVKTRDEAFYTCFFSVLLQLMSPLGNFSWVNLKIILCGYTRSYQCDKIIEIIQKIYIMKGWTMTITSLTRTCSFSWHIQNLSTMKVREKINDFTLQLNFHLFHKKWGWRNGRIRWPVNCANKMSVEKGE